MQVQIKKKSTANTDLGKEPDGAGQEYDSRQWCLERRIGPNKAEAKEILSCNKYSFVYETPNT